MKAAPLTQKPSFPLMKQGDIQNVYHLQMSRWLFIAPRYMGLALESKVAYTFLLNRFQLSRLNGSNDWNHITRKAGVHAWVGKLTSGEVSCVQAGEWNKQAWGCGPGKNGSCNDGWIQFEICEDSLKDPTYFQAVYQEAVELTAYLCAIYKLDPLGTVAYKGVKVPVILCHQDSYRLGLGSNHGDVLHWFPRHGKTMNDFRANVAHTMKGDNEDMDQEKFNQMFATAMQQYRKELRDNDCGDWSQKARQFAVDNKIFAGSGTTPEGEPNYMWEDLLTREQAAQLLYAFAQKFSLA